MKREIGNYQRLQHMWDATEKIRKFSADLTYEQLIEDDRTSAAIVHYFTILGEAAARITSEFRANHPEIPWVQIVGFRNVVVHQYFDVDYSVMWDSIQHDLGPLRALLKPIIDALPTPPPLPPELDALEGHEVPLQTSTEMKGLSR